jgi:hypothetical protein
MEAINPLPKVSVEVKHRKSKSRESEIVSGTPYKSLIESKETDKITKMKETAERQLKWLEAQE